MGAMDSGDPVDAGVPPASPARCFRIEHRRDGGVVAVLGHVHDAFPHHDTLTPYVSRLLRESAPLAAHDEVVLIDQESNRVLARRSLSRGLSPRRPTPARARRAS